MPNIRQYINLLYFKRKIPCVQTPLSEYAAMLNAGTPFSFSRFGDGEWLALLGRSGSNCDGHEFFPAMSEKLRESIIRPSGEYLFAIQRYAIKQLGREIWRFLKKNRISIIWHFSDVFHYANSSGQLFPFIDALKSRDVVLVGPAYLRGIDKRLVNYADFVEVPRVNCFLSIDRIKQDILTCAQKKPGTVFGFTASMTANCIIHDLYPLIGKEHTMLDLGSLWDGYLGLNTRSFCTEFNWADNFKKNTGT
jgi:hypothetical protein